MALTASVDGSGDGDDVVNTWLCSTVWLTEELKRCQWKRSLLVVVEKPSILVDTIKQVARVLLIIVVLLIK